MHIRPFYYCEACKTDHLVPPADFHATQALGAIYCDECYSTNHPYPLCPYMGEDDE